MPWCPQCGAEYREGVARCAKCGLPLTDETPTLEATPWRERLPPRLRWIADDFVRAVGYLAEAWRVLRRHPVLLILPLAVALFNAAERGTMYYITYRYTAAGREIMAHRPPASEPSATEVRLRSRDLFQMWRAVGRLASPTPGPSLQGTLQLVTLGATGRPGVWLGSFVGWVFYLLVALPLGALVLAGYYGVVGKAVAAGVVSWGLFWPCVRRYVLRFFLFGVLMTALTGGLAGIALSIWVTAALYRATTFAGGAITFALALTLVAIVADDATLLRALRSGAAVVLRGLPVAAIFLAAWIVVLAVSAVLSYLIALAENALLPPVDLTTLQLYLIPEKAVVDGFLAAAGTWLLIASFVWYRDRRPGVPRPAGGSEGLE